MQNRWRSVTILLTCTELTVAAYVTGGRRAARPEVWVAAFPFDLVVAATARQMPVPWGLSAVARPYCRARGDVPGWRALR